MREQHGVDVRADVVNEMVETGRRATRDANRLFDDRMTEVVHRLRPTPDEMIVVVHRTRLDLQTDMEDAGVIEPDTSGTSILDSPIRPFVAFAKVYAELEDPWRTRHPGLTLGGLLKIVPADVAAHVEGLLRWGGLLPPHMSETGDDGVGR